MSGHSKWHSIRRTKGVLDARRGALFTKLAREITVAAREGGADPDMNFRLRLAVDKARQSNMPNDNIKRAIDRASGKGAELSIDEITYEGYGPGGVAIMVEAATDNRNRTASDVRSTFTKSGGNLGESGSVGWMFEAKGLVTVEFPTEQSFDADEVMLQVIDAGADDVEVDGSIVEVYTAAEDLNNVRLALEAQHLPILECRAPDASDDTIHSRQRERGARGIAPDGKAGRPRRRAKGVQQSRRFGRAGGEVRYLLGEFQVPGFKFQVLLNGW